MKSKREKTFLGSIWGKFKIGNLCDFFSLSSSITSITGKNNLISLSQARITGVQINFSLFMNMMDFCFTSYIFMLFSVFSFRVQNWHFLCLLLSFLVEHFSITSKNHRYVNETFLFLFLWFIFVLPHTSLCFFCFFCFFIWTFLSSYG